MRKFWRVFRVILAVIVILAGYAGYHMFLGKPFTFNMLLNRQAVYLLLDNPQVLTELGLIDGTWLDFHSGKMNEYSLAKRERDYNRVRKYIDQIKEWDRDDLSPQEQISYDMTMTIFNHQLGFEEFDWLGAGGDLYPTNQFSGLHISLPDFMQFQHVVKNAKTARHYVDRLEGIGPVIGQVNGDIQRQATLGVVPPDFSIHKTIEELKSFLASAPEKHPLVMTFSEKLSTLDELDVEEKDRLKNAAIAAVRESVYPAYRRLLQREQELGARAAHDAGVWRLPDGDTYYAARLREQTTTNLSADEIHNYGLSEVARITREMDAVLKTQAMSEGTVGERMIKINYDPRFTFENTEEGREKVLKEYKDDIARALAAAPRYFSRLPKALVEVRPVPEYSEQGAAGASYNSPALDGSRPGIVFVNLRYVTETPFWANHTIAFHEGVPGHHFQIALAQELEGLPFLRRVYSPPSFAEGWALYSERLAKEMGMYEGDSFGDLGRLRDELFRAVRLVADTGIHARQWTREQAIDYMMEKTGMGEKETTAEIERYAVSPAQACAYKIGMKAIMDIRDSATNEQGDKFDIKAFHDAVLLNGGMPLDVFQTYTDRWRAEQKAK